MNNIRISKEVISNKAINNNGLMSYIGLSLFKLDEIGMIYTSISSIESSLRGALKRSRYLKEKLREGLINLNENGIITIKSKREHFLDNETIKIVSHKVYTNSSDSIVLYINEIEKVVNYNKTKIQQESLLRYFVSLIDVIDPITKIGTKTIDDLALISGVSDNTIKTRYNGILEGLELIYIQRFNASDDEIGIDRNVYGRYEDKLIIQSRAKGHGLCFINIQEIHVLKSNIENHQEVKPCNEKGSYLYVMEEGDEIIYVGATSNMHKRAAEHRSGCTNTSHFIKKYEDLNIIYIDSTGLVDNKNELYFLENELIISLKPVENKKINSVSGISLERKKELAQYILSTTWFKINK